MTELETKLNQIWDEKSTKIIPTNIKKNVNVLGITGSYEGEPPTLQSKTATITQNGTQTITADSGYDGLDEVEVNVNVSETGNNAKIKSTITVNELYKSIVSFDLVDTSSLTTMNSMFYGCSSLETIPLLNTANVIDMSSMFKNCSSLITIPLINTSNVTTMNEMFARCGSLTSIPLIDTGNVTNMGGMFYQCNSLTTIPLLNTSKVTTMQNMFSSCNNLTDTSLNNILAMCANATNYTATKTLSYIGVSNSSYYSVIPTLSNYQAFIDAGWTIS